MKGSPLEAMLLGGLKQLSPMTWVTGAAPPFLMIHGTADSLVPFGQSEECVPRCAKSGCELRRTQCPFRAQGTG